MTIVGQISSLVPYKGQMVLLDAVLSVLPEFPNTMFLLVGYVTPKDTAFRDRLLEKAKALGIEDHIRICGYPGHIGDVWQIIDIHVHASLFDSLPVAIIEGMSLGKPAVVTSVGGIPELVQHETTGIVVPPGDPEELARGLKRLLRDHDTAKRLGSAALARYTQSYDPVVRTRQQESLFLDISKKNRRPLTKQDLK